MCGIAGAMVSRPYPSGELTEHARRMSACVTHRGPDAAGTWVDAASGIALGHRRLAILDLTETGAQPMQVQDRYVITYNGEIYNHQQLRQRLVSEGCRLRGSSDTEVLLEAVGRWGVEQTLNRIDGMFAFALWDRLDRTLTLARDRMGEKPLYVGWAGTTLLFGSELSALRAHPHFAASVDDNAVADLLRWSCIPAPRTVYRGISKLPPGHLLTVAAGAPPGALPWRPYWSLADLVAQTASAREAAHDPADLDELEQVLSESVRRQMVADVSVGCFLSGGVDSSLVAALAQEASDRPIRTFSMGFTEAAWDEAPYARLVAERLGTDHVEQYVSAADALEVIPQLADIYGEPFADSSQIPTVLVSRLARGSVTVALSGDGGDELFAGYDRYRVHGRLSALAERTPATLRRAGAAAVLGVPAVRWDATVRRAAPLLGTRGRVSRPGEKLHKAARLLQRDPSGLYDALMSTWPEPGDALLAGVAMASPLDLPTSLDPVRRLQYLDQMRYLPDDLLVKVDRAAMSVGLETRVPLLGVAVVRASWRLPTSSLLVAGRGKHPLRQLLSRRVPAQIVDRPKQGFGVPLGAWLRGPLRSWAGDLLSQEALKRDGRWRSDNVAALLSEHVGGVRDHSAQLWPVLMFRAWEERA